MVRHFDDERLLKVLSDKSRRGRVDINLICATISSQVQLHINLYTTVSSDQFHSMDADKEYSSTETFNGPIL